MDIAVINYKSIDLQAVEAQIQEVTELMKSPMPTPPVGTLVLWYDKAMKLPGAEVSALVTKIEGPGKVTLTIFRPFSMPIHKRGCFHCDNPIHEKRHNDVSANSGSWDYVQGKSIPIAHYTMHLEELAKRKDAMMASLAEAKAVSEKEEAKFASSKQVAKAAATK